MTARLVVLPLALGLLPGFGFPALGADETATQGANPPVRVYTNEDLDRVHPLREQTGVASVPAAPPDEARSGSRSRARSHGEEYWRHEAARVRDRVASLETQAADLRQRVADLEWEQRHVSRRVSATAASPVGRLRSRLSSIERRARRLEDDLQERARREGALPGWLR
jgi:septal ring factor EnvC (AmiA/AmiB activator)